MEGPEGKEGGLIAIEGRGEGTRRERRERWGCQLQASGEHCCWRGRVRVKSVADGLCATLVQMCQECRPSFSLEVGQLQGESSRCSSRGAMEQSRQSQLAHSGTCWAKRA
jgi:hypothetical protein